MGIACWRHDVERLSSLPTLCEGSPMIFPHKRPAMRPVHSPTHPTPPPLRTSNAELDFLRWDSVQFVEQTLELPVIWDAKTLMWRLCNALSCDRTYCSNIRIRPYLRIWLPRFACSYPTTEASNGIDFYCLSTAVQMKAILLTLVVPRCSSGARRLFLNVPFGLRKNIWNHQ